MARLDAAWLNFAKRGKTWDHFWQDAASTGPAAVGASVAVTDGADALGASVALIVAASSAKTDGTDVLAGNAAALVATSGATTDGADALAGAVAPVVAGSSARTDGADVLAGSTGLTVAASLAPIDGADVLAGQASPAIAVSTARSDGADLLAAAAAPIASTSVATTDGPDAAAAGVVTVIDADPFSAAVAPDAAAIVVLPYVPYRNSEMSDITTVWNASLLRGDWVQQGSALQAGGDVITGVLISLFTDRIANEDDAIPDGTGDPRGWWADDAQHPIGSRLWLLSREKQLDLVPQRAKDYCKEALQWLIDDGVVSSFDVAAEWVRSSLLGVQVTAHRRNDSPVSLKFSAAWDFTGITFTVGDTPLN